LNIFILDNDPVIAAQYHCDKHVVKMCVESTQILCTSLRLRGIKSEKITYKSTHTKHPCVKWAANKNGNMQWLYVHAIALCNEYTKRYGKIHKSQYVLNEIKELIQFEVIEQHEDFVLAMPEIYKSFDAVESYRKYYSCEKRKFAKWKIPSTQPKWWNNE